MPPGATLAQFALRWILMFDAVTCTIPGARTPAQVIDNTGAASLPALTDETMAAAREVYDKHIRDTCTRAGRSAHHGGTESTDEFFWVGRES